jgi:hypothetical protein
VQIWFTQKKKAEAPQIFFFEISRFFLVANNGKGVLLI